MRTVTLLALAVGLVGCNPFAPKCSPDRQVVEVEYTSSLFDFELGQLNTYRGRGYSCADDGAIRNGFGQVIGNRYVCTKC